jgi:mRNA-degrading endonuclease RelE of RelBE toxin-antitoxin system
VTYRLKVARGAARALTDQLPEQVASAVIEFLNGPILDNPQRVGKRLRAPLDGKWSARRGQYRVIYEIDDSKNIVVVLQVTHRTDAYR